MNYIWGNRLGITHRWQPEPGGGYAAICGLAMPADEEPDGDDGRAGDVRICPVCDPASGAVAPDQAVKSALPVWVDLDLIEDNPYQPRHEYREDDLVQLVESIRAHGLLQVPLARLVDIDGTPLGSSPSLVLSTAGTVGRAQVAFGHRRLRAYRRLAESDSMMFGHMPLLFRDLNDETMAAHAWSENRDRSDLSAWEEAKAIEKRMQVFGWNQTEAAKKMGMDRSTISNKLRLLKLPAAQQTALHAGELTERQAMALLPLLDLPEEIQRRDGWGEPSTILANAKTQSSDGIRHQVESAMNRHSRQLASAPFAEVEIDGDLVCALCTVCPERIKYNGGYRCPNADCYDRKMAWWIDQALEAAMNAAGDLLIGGNYSSLPHGSYEDFYVNREQFQQIRQTGCPKGNLKLFYNRDSGGASYNKIDGHPHAVILCSHGAHRKCTCLAAKKAVLDKQRKEIERHRTERADAILAPAKAAILAGLRTRNLLIWRMLTDHLFYDADARTKIAKITTVEDLEAIIVDKLLSGMPGISSYAAIDPDLAREAATAILKMLPDVCTQTPDPEPDVCTQTPDDTIEDVTDTERMVVSVPFQVDRGTVSAIKKRVRAVGGTWYKYLPHSGFWASFPGIQQECYATVEAIEKVLRQQEKKEQEAA